MTVNEHQTWFHGSPFQLGILKKGSSITRNERLAQAFSTRPGIVSVSDDGRIKHNGTMKGLVYKIVDEVSMNDIYKHPATAMPDAWEWVTKKEFSLEFLYEFTAPRDDILTEDEISALVKLNS